MPGLFLTPERAARVTAAVVERLGGASPAESAPEELLAAGSAVAAEDFTAFPGRWGRLAFASVPFMPVVDGEVLPSLPWPALAGGAARDVDLVVGFTRDEFDLFLSMDAATGDPGRPGHEPEKAVTHVFDVHSSDVADPEASSRALWSAAGIGVID